MTGVKVNKDDNKFVSITSIPTFKGHSPQYGSRFQKVKYDIDMPKNWNLIQNKQVKIGSHDMDVKLVNRCKFMIFIHGITDIPRQYIKNGKRYSIRY